MNSLQKALARLLFGETTTKSLLDLHPELRDREPIMRVWSDAETQQGSGYQAAISDYAGNVWVHKAVKIIADNLSTLRVRVVRGDEDEEMTHPVADLLNYVNPIMSTSDLWHQWVLNMLLGGECGFELVRNGARGYAEVWPHSPTQFNVRVNKRARYGNVTGYRIDDGQGEPFDLPPDEFIHFKFYNPANPWRGLAPITAVRMGILIDEYAQAWARMLFSNGARPDYAVITPQGITPREREEILAKLEARHGGLNNAYRPIVLEQGVTDIKPFSWPPKDTDWIKQREMSREEIGALFGVPDEMMGWGRDTYENFGMALKVFWQLTLMPLINKRDGQLSEFFARVGALKAGERVDTDLSDVQALQADRAALIDQAVKLFSMGVPLQEINTLVGLGLGEIAGTDVGYLGSSLVPVTRVGSGPAPERPAPPASPAPAPEEEPAQKSMTRAEARIPYGGQMHKALWALFRERTEDLEAEMKRKLKREFQEQQNRIAQAVRATQPEQLALEGVFNKADEIKRWRMAFRPVFETTIKNGGEHGVDQTGMAGIAFDVKNPRVQEAIDVLLWDFTDEVTDTTQSALKDLLKDAIDEGLSIPKISDKIAELYDGFKGARAETIARTETIKAYNNGSNEGYRQAGVTRRGWLSALDERTRTPPKSEFDHVAAHGEEVDMDAPFVKTGEALDYPGDPNGSPGNVINCRCTLYPIVEVG